MGLSGIWAGFYKWSVWITRFAWLNLLFIGFTLAGLVLFGWMPALLATFTVVRKWVQKDYDIPIFQTFLLHFKKSFLHGNLFALLLIVAGYVLSIYLKYTGLMYNSSFYPILFGLFFIGLVLYVMLFLNLPAVYAHYQLSFWQYIRYALSIGVVNLHFSISAITVLAIIYYISMKTPLLIFFFSFSTSAYFVMLFANLGFIQLWRKKEKALQREQSSISPSKTW